MNPQMLQGIGAILGGFTAVLVGIYIVITRPLQRYLKAEITAAETRLKAEIMAVEIRLNERLAAMRDTVKGPGEIRIYASFEEAQAELPPRIANETGKALGLRTDETAGYREVPLEGV
jgi:hypothetical protein